MSDYLIPLSPVAEVDQEQLERETLSDVVLPLITNQWQLTAAFESVQRHVLTLPDGSQEIHNTQLTPGQTQILHLLGISANTYG